MSQNDEGSGDLPELPSRRSRGRRSTRRRRILLVTALVLFVLLIPVGVSYYGALTAPGSTGWTTRSIEWVKSHGGRGFVLAVERWWYSHHPPPTGGTPTSGPLAGPAFSTDPAPSPTKAPKSPIPQPPHLPLPKDVNPMVSNPLPREGVWRPVGPTVDGLPVEEVAYMRPDSVHTSLTAGLVWMDTRLLDAELIPGTQVPGPGWPGTADVPRSKRSDLAATFNSGFLLNDANGGFYLNGRTAGSLRNGAASLVIYKDGTATVGQWGRDVHMSTDVAAVRQNLQLIVDHGQPVPSLSNNSFYLWGATLGNAVMVWRSGVGVDKNGGLIYAAGPGMSITSLARLLARAGAVRAMELDINTEWVSFNYYNHVGSSLNPAKLLPQMYRPAYRYLVPDERDFIAMYVRKTLTTTPPT